MVNLHAYDAGDAALDPAEALHGFLEALGVPAQRIPLRSQARSDLFRSAIAGRRVLMLLDNARDAEQVRPLLPGTAGCMSIVTSRDVVTGLLVLGRRATAAGWPAGSRRGDPDGRRTRWRCAGSRGT
jgi:hypothetical protein